MVRAPAPDAHRHRVARGARLGLGVGLGAALAVLGNSIVFVGPPWRIEGASLLFVPLGVLLVAPSRASLGALPLVFAVARLGCVAQGCCYLAPWSALWEVAGYVGLHGLARRWPEQTVPFVLAGFGAIRLLSLPLRVDPPAGALVDPAWIAAAWIVAGVALRGRIRSAPAAAGGPLVPRRQLLHALVWVFGISLLSPLAGALVPDPGLASLIAAAAALALLRPPQPTFTALLRFAVGLGAGLALARAAGSVRPAAGAALADPLSVAAVALLAPIVEERLYRERLLGALRSLWGAPTALVVSSALFALAHPDPAVAPVAFAGGLVCGLVVLASGSLALATGLHVGWNLAVLGAL